MSLHSELTGDDLHEVKGADAADAGQVLSADGLGATTFVAPSSLINIELGDEASAYSAVSQAPVGLGSPRVLDFDTVESTDDVTVDPAGTFTFNTPGVYFVSWGATVGRGSGGSGTARIGFRLQLNGSQLGRARSIFADGADAVYTPIEFNLLRYFDEGDVLRSQIIRDSAGNNSGEANGRDLTDWNDGSSVYASAVRVIGS